MLVSMKKKVYTLSTMKQKSNIFFWGGGVPHLSLEEAFERKGKKKKRERERENKQTKKNLMRASSFIHHKRSEEVRGVNDLYLFSINLYRLVCIPSSDHDRCLVDIAVLKSGLTLLAK